MKTHIIRIGTRASRLAQWQANWVAEQLKSAGFYAELVVISTKGDRMQKGPVGLHLGDTSSPDSGMGLFTREIQTALLCKEVDVAVHSLKDLPTEKVPGLCLAAVPLRAPVEDVLILKRELSTLPDSGLSILKEGVRVGTSSLRRRAQLLAYEPNMEICGVRGNVETRINKLETGVYDAIILARAGVERLGLAEHITQIIPSEILMPAVGQGALGLETRVSDSVTRAALETLHHPETYADVMAERAMLTALGGGCLTPVGAITSRDHTSRLTLRGRVIAVDGRVMIDAVLTAQQDELPESLGIRVAQKLLRAGAGEYIREARSV